MEKKTDEELIALCKEKDEAAFNELYKRYYPVAYKLAYHISKSDADARDAAQEVMITVYQYIDTLKQPQYFSLWLKRIVVGKCNRIFRKNKNMKYMDNEALIMQHQKDEVRDHNPMKQIHFDNDQELLGFFISMLPEAQEEVMKLFYFEQLSIKEISKKLNIPEGTIKSRIFAAKKKLKELINGYEEKEQTSIDFQSDALLASLGSGVVYSTMKQMHPWSSFFTSSILKYAVVLTLALSSAGIVASVVYQKQESPNTQDIIRLNETESIHNQAEEKQFQTVELSTMKIENAQDAYFKLQLMMDHEDTWNYLNDQERIEIKELYQAIKQYGGTYYTLLEQNGWNEKFRQYVD